MVEQNNNWNREFNNIQDCLDSEYYDWINEQIEKNHQNAEQ